jgi:hypothetical protein
MAELPELITLASVLVAVLSLVVHYRLLMMSGSGLFAYSLLIVAAIAVATLAASLAPANPGAQAVTDVGILMAGALAFAASGWLIFAFGMAGEAGGR